MIVLPNDFNTRQAGNNKTDSNGINQPSTPARSKMQNLLQKICQLREAGKQRKTDRLALNQLMQLDDALLKDMGLTRSELNAVKRGNLSFDALIKHDIVSTRDYSGSAQPIRKQSPQAKEFD